MHQELEITKRIAVRAGAILLDHQARSANSQGHGRVLAEACESVSAFLVKELKRLFPADGVLPPGDADPH
jgi:hypothetical protein